MLRPTNLLSTACAAGLVALAVAAGPVLSAAADATDGTITVVVNRDVNDNGDYDAGDAPQGGIDITVTDASGSAVSGRTDDHGTFVVPPTERLTGGRYFVAADIPDDLELTPVSESTSFQPLSTTVDVTSESQTVRLGVARRVSVPAPPTEPPPATDPPPAREAAPAPPRFAVGDHVWRDVDRQGRQDAGEPAAARTSVQLLAADGTVVDSTTTDADGRYAFDGLAAGIYSVRFAGIPSGSRLSSTRIGSPDADSDPDYTGVTPPFSLEVGAANVRRATAADGVNADYINPTVDAGIAPVTFAIGSQVWHDLNRDGLQDAAEPAGQAEVALLDARGNEVATTRTDGQGQFLFANLAAGRYALRFSGLGNHQALTRARIGDDPAVDSEPDPGTGTTPMFLLSLASTNLVPAADFGPVDADFVDTTLNAGLVTSYSIANRVWLDANQDGMLSPNEAGIDGVKVELIDLAGAVVATTRTDRQGRYSFTSLAAGEYRLRFSEIPEGLYFTATGVGGDPLTDSDVYADALTAPIAVGEDHPAETAVGAGLTSSPSAAATTTAPASTAPATFAGGDQPLSSTGGVPVGIPIAGAFLLVLGAAALLYNRRRRS